MRGSKKREGREGGAEVQYADEPGTKGWHKMRRGGVFFFAHLFTRMGALPE